MTLCHATRRMLLAIALLGLGAPNAAMAADRFAVVGIENTTKANIRMEHRWGEASWQTDVLAPGKRRLISWEYKKQNANESPKLHVRFDSDVSPGKYIENYDLNKKACPDKIWECAHKYVFRYDTGTKKFIELYDQGKK